MPAQGFLRRQIFLTVDFDGIMPAHFAQKIRGRRGGRRWSNFRRVQHLTADDLRVLLLGVRGLRPCHHQARKRRAK